MSLNLAFVFVENVLVSYSCNQRALRNEIMVLEVLEAQEPAVFRQILFNTLTHYHEEIQSMSGASGRQKPKHFKRTMLDDEVVAGGDESLEFTPAAAAEDTAGNVQQPQPLPAAYAESSTTLATPPAKQHKGKRRAGSGGEK
jgi:hypothetical protein